MFSENDADGENRVCTEVPLTPPPLLLPPLPSMLNRIAVTPPRLPRPGADVPFVVNTRSAPPLPLLLLLLLLIPPDGDAARLFHTPLAES